MWKALTGAAAALFIWHVALRPLVWRISEWFMQKPERQLTAIIFIVIAAIFLGTALTAHNPVR